MELKLLTVHIKVYIVISVLEKDIPSSAQKPKFQFHLAPLQMKKMLIYNRIDYHSMPGTFEMNEHYLPIGSRVVDTDVPPPK